MIRFESKLRKSFQGAYSDIGNTFINILSNSDKLSSTKITLHSAPAVFDDVGTLVDNRDLTVIDHWDTDMRYGIVDVGDTL